jgi:hypothetical protein
VGPGGYSRRKLYVQSKKSGIRVRIGSVTDWLIF